MQVVAKDNVNAGVPGFYGYVALTTDAQKMLAITVHTGIHDNGPDPDGPSGFHSHIVNVVGNCESGLQVSASPFSVGTLTLNGHQVSVSGVSSSDLGTFSGKVLSFTIHLEGGKVCVVPADTYTITDQNNHDWQD